MKISLDKQKTILIAGIIISITILFNIFLAPQCKQLKAASRQYASAVELIKIRQVKQEQLKNLNDNKQQGQSAADTFESKFIDESQVNFFLKDLDRLAWKTKNKLESLDPLEGETEIAPGIKEMAVKVNIVGGYSTILDFLKALTSYKKLVSITDIVIEPDQGAGQALEASFLLKLFIIETGS